jgi:hypothetical protein
MIALHRPFIMTVGSAIAAVKVWGFGVLGSP